MTHSDSLWVNALKQHGDSLQRSMDSLQTKLDALQAKNDLFCSVVESVNDGVSNQLSATNNFLALIAVILTIAAIWLGVLVEKRKRQIEKIAETVNRKKKEVESLAKATEELDKQIHGNLSVLYKDLRKEETDALLDRLVLEPQDIINLNSILFARDIDELGYVKLKTAFMKMQKYLENDSQEYQGHDYREFYIALFYQHFFYHALKDDEISPLFEDYYNDILTRAYKRDVIKSTIDLCKALSDDNTSFNKEEVLTSYLKALNYSQHKGLKELKNIFEQNIIPKTLLQSAIESCKKDHVYLQLFGINSPGIDEKKSQ